MSGRDSALPDRAGASSSESRAPRARVADVEPRVVEGDLDAARLHQSLAGALAYHEDSVASASVRGLDHEVGITREPRAQAAQLVVLADRPVERRDRDARVFGEALR